MKEILILLLIILSLSNGIKSQDAEWINFTDGHTVIDLVKDSNILWIATSGGIVKYDIPTRSKTFYTKVNSGIKHYNFTSVTVDHEHNLWVGTDGTGILFFNGIDWSYLNDNLPTPYISDVETDYGGNVYIGCRGWLEEGSRFRIPHWGGVVKFDGQNWEPITPNLQSLSRYFIKTDKNGIVYIADGKLKSLEDNEFKIHYPEGDSAAVINKFTIDEENHIWILKNTTTLTRYDGTTWHNHTVPDGITADMLYASSICSDSLNNIWLGFDSNESGLLKYSGNDQWTTYNTTNSEIETNRISSLNCINGLLYIGTNGKELKVLEGENTWSEIPTSNSPLTNNWMNANLFTDKAGNLLTSTTRWNEDGQDGVNVLLKFDGTDFVVTDSIPILHTKEIITDPSGHIWLAGFNGVGRYDGTDWMTFNKDNAGFPNNDINSITIDNNNIIWIAGGSSYNAFIAKYDQSFWTIYTPSPALVPYEFYKIVVDNQNRKWIGGFEGLYRFDGVQWELFNDITAHVFKLQYDSVNNLLWLATSEGLVRYNFTDFMPITSAGVQACGLDTRNNIWISHETLQCYNSDGNLLTTFTAGTSGYPTLYVRDISITDDGNLFLATGGSGLIQFTGAATAPVEDIDLQTPIFHAYPNPGSGFITIALKHTPNLQNIVTIYDLNGRKVSSFEFTGQNAVIDISALPKGIHILQLNNKQGSYSIKLVVGK